MAGAKPKKKVRVVCYEADEVKQLAEGLIPEFHGTLRDARIEYVLKTREDEVTDTVLQPRVQDGVIFCDLGAEQGKAVINI